MNYVREQNCNNTWNTSIPHGVLSFQVELVDKFKLMEDMYADLCMARARSGGPWWV